MRKIGLFVLFSVLLVPGIALGAPVYWNTFETDTTASWTVNKAPATTDEAHDFFFDYSTVGIPQSPSGGGTRGMKLQANQSSAVFGGMSVSPTGLNVAGNQNGDYEVRFDWWASFNGPAPVGGSGSTMLSTFGVDTSGSVAQWPGGTQDSIWFGATADGNSSSDWRAYSPAPAGVTRYADTAPGIYAAGAVAGSSNASNAYYSGFGTVSAPAAQVLLFPQQTGTTLVGSAGWEWHEVVIKKSSGNVTWTVDGTLIATVPTADDIVATGNNIFFGHSDTNTTSSNDVNDVNLLFTLIDNVRVVVPEPASGLLVMLGALSILGAARRR